MEQTVRNDHFSLWVQLSTQPCDVVGIGRGFLMRYLLMLIVTIAIYQAWVNYSDKPLSGAVAQHDELIMYSLTTCGYCKQKRQTLTEQGITFIEYFIDQDHLRQDELNGKLSEAGLPPKRYGTPIFDVKGTILPNNPSMDTIKWYL